MTAACVRCRTDSGVAQSYIRVMDKTRRTKPSPPGRPTASRPMCSCALSRTFPFCDGSQMIAEVWPAILLIFLELTVITAVAILFSSFSTPALSAMLTFAVFVIGHFSTSLRELAQSMPSQFARMLFDGVYYLLPNLSLFSFRTEAALGLSPGGSLVLGAFAYAFAYIAVMITIAILIFSARDFK